MERKSREELKKLSTEFLGGPYKYKKYIKGIAVDSNEMAPNGRPIKVFKYLTEEEVLELLQTMKKNQEDDQLAADIQEQAGGTAE